MAIPQRLNLPLPGGDLESWAHQLVAELSNVFSLDESFSSGGNVNLPILDGEGREIVSTDGITIYDPADVPVITPLAINIDTEHLVNAAITTAKLADLSVDVDKLADLAVEAAKLANGAVVNSKLADLAVDVNKLADAAVDTTKLANLAVDASKLANQAVTSTKIANLAVGAAAIANAAIGSVHIGSGIIQAAHIENAAVGSAAIANAAVGTAHIANAAITSALIGDAQVLGAKIANAQIDDAHINDLSAAKIIAGTIGAHIIDVGSSRFRLDGGNQRLRFYDNQGPNVLRVELGNLASGAGSTDYGLEVWDATGTLIFSSGRVFDSSMVDALLTANAPAEAGADVTDYTDTRVANAIRENGVTTIYRPIGATNEWIGNQTGAIKITLPQSWSDTMMKMAVDVFDFNENKSFTLFLAGYNFDGTSTWTRVSTQLIGSIAADNRVRFAHDGTKCCIIIGETTSSWDYLKVSVRDFQASHTGDAIDDWDDGWSVSLITSMVGITTTRDISDAFLDASSIKNQGDLATEDAADWATQIAGAGKPEDNATVGADVGTNFYRPNGTTLINETDFINAWNQITSGNITTFMASAAIGTAQIANAAITNALIANLAVDTAQIIDAAITSAKIGTSQVQTTNIQNAAITNAKIGTAAVDTANIVDAAVETLKIAGQAVTIPSSVYTAGDITITQNYVTVASVTYTATGNPVHLFAGFFRFHVEEDSGNPDVIYKIRRTGAGGSTDVIETTKRLSENVDEGVLFARDTPGVGSVTYSLQVRLSFYVASSYAGKRSLMALETKR